MTALAHSSIATAIQSIRRLVRILRLDAEHTQRATGVSAAQLFVLGQLEAGTTLSLTGLAARTLTDRSSVADIVDRLRTRRLVVRAIDPSDRRRAAVRITPAGRRLLAHAPEAPTSALIVALQRLTHRERAMLAHALSRLSDALGGTDSPAPLLFAEREVRRPRRSGRSRDR